MQLYSLALVSVPTTTYLYPYSLQRYQFHHPCTAIVTISVSLNHTDILIYMRLYPHLRTHVTNPLYVVGSAIFSYELHISIFLFKIDDIHSGI